MVKKPEAIPHTSGVYIFKRGRTPVYIGKAGNLKKRLASYFRVNAAPKVRALREEATVLEWQETRSEIEALILEAELIKRHLPKYNVLLRDDKSYFYVTVTREKFSKIIITHQPRLMQIYGGSTSLYSVHWRKVLKQSIGPFTSGSALFSTLKLLRRIFPYCTCKQSHKRPCVNAQIGRCQGFCCHKSKSQIINPKSQKEYATSIRNIIAVLSGKRKRILSQLKRDMRTASKKQEFEQAARLRDQIAGLENVFSHEQVLRPRFPETGNRGARARHWQSIKREISAIIGADKKISRVEGYDVSNISGTAASGSMVVFIDGQPVKSLYRKFKIKTVHQPNDVAMHQEMMRRRLAHPEWGMPDMIVIDGGLPQINAVGRVLRIKNKESGIILTALAKREEELYIEGREKPVRLDTLSRDAMLFFQHVRDESHRFAKKYHHKLREISYRQK